MAESWWITNKTRKTIVIGDLPRVPELGPNKKIDLLVYASKEEIGQSSVLSGLIQSGTFSLQKVSDVIRGT